jgi:hypothetical protein
VIFWEWIDPRGVGAMSGAILEGAQQAKVDQRLDRIEEIPVLTFDAIKGHIYPFRGRLKKIKIRGNIAVRPILVLGPFDKEHEVTFLLVAEERDNVLRPSDDEVAKLAEQRLNEILRDPKRRRRYERY